MTEDEARFVDAAAALEKIMGVPGFRFLMDLVRDEFDAERVFSDVPARPGWTHGEEYAYAKGRRDAAAQILGLPEEALERAREIMRDTQMQPLEGEGEQPKYQ